MKESWAGPAETKESWAGPAETKESWAGPGETKESWAGPAETTDQHRTADTRRLYRETNEGNEGDTAGATETKIKS